GWLADALGWRAFYWFTIAAGIPGMLLLARFVPLGVREPHFSVETAPSGPPLSNTQIALRGALGGTLALACARALSAAMAAFKASSADGATFASALATLVRPTDLGAWLRLFGIGAVGLAAGLFTAAAVAARHGAGALAAEE